MPSLEDADALHAAEQRRGRLLKIAVSTVAATACVAGAVLFLRPGASVTPPAPPADPNTRQVTIYVDGWSARTMSSHVRLGIPAGVEVSSTATWQDTPLTPADAGDITALLQSDPELVADAAARMWTSDSGLSCSTDGCTATPGSLDAAALAAPGEWEGIGAVYSGWQVASTVYTATVTVPKSVTHVFIAPGDDTSGEQWSRWDFTLPEDGSNASIAAMGAFGRVAPLTVAWRGENAATFALNPLITPEIGAGMPAISQEDQLTGEEADGSSGIAPASAEAQLDAVAEAVDEAPADPSAPADVTAVDEVADTPVDPGVVEEAADTPVDPDSYELTDPLLPDGVEEFGNLMQGLSVPVPATAEMSPSQLTWYSSPSVGCDVAILCAPAKVDGVVTETSTPAVLDMVDGNYLLAGQVSYIDFDVTLPAPVPAFGLGEPVGGAVPGMRDLPLSVATGQLSGFATVLKVWADGQLLLLDGSIADARTSPDSAAPAIDAFASRVSYGGYDWDIRTVKPLVID